MQHTYLMSSANITIPPLIGGEPSSVSYTSHGTTLQGTLTLPRPNSSRRHSHMPTMFTPQIHPNCLWQQFSDVTQTFCTIRNQTGPRNCWNTAVLFPHGWPYPGMCIKLNCNKNTTWNPSCGRGMFPLIQMQQYYSLQVTWFYVYIWIPATSPNIIAKAASGGTITSPPTMPLPHLTAPFSHSLSSSKMFSFLQQKQCLQPSSINAKRHSPLHYLWRTEPLPTTNNHHHQQQNSTRFT